MPAPTIDSLLATQKEWAPNYPFVRPGLCMHHFGDHFVLLSGEGLTAEGFAAQMDEVERLIVAGPEVPLAQVIHLGASRWMAELSLSEKTAGVKRWAAVATRHEQRLRKLLKVGAIISTTTLARAMLRTVLALRPPVAPTIVCSTAAEAWTAVKRVFPAVDVEVYTAAHEQLAAKHVPSLVESIRARKR
jgi:hypothetical protein